MMNATDKFDEQTPPLWLQYLPGAIYRTDAEGRLIYCNVAAMALWGRSTELDRVRWSGAAKLYRSNGAILSSNACPAAVALQEGREISGEDIFVESSDGSRRLVLWNAKPIFDGTGALTGSANLLTEIKSSTDTLEEKVRSGMVAIEAKQGELNRNEERYHKMISEIEDYAILLLDDRGFVVNWNIGAEKIKGYTEAEIVGKHFRIFYTKGDQENKLPEKLIDQAFRAGKAIHEGWRQRKDGTLFWGSIVITALHDESGNVYGFSKVTRDLTARRIAEERLQRNAAELEFQNRELQQFAYAAAHDMKEPLRKLRYYNTWVYDSLKDRLSEKEEQYLRRASDAAARMQTLIDDLLTYSKASTEGGAFAMVSLDQMVAEAQVTYQELIQETGAAVEIKDLPEVWGIGFQLRQLFENLLGNALKYRDQSRTPLIRITCDKNYYSPDGTLGTVGLADEYFRIRVEDNGIGFEEEKAGKIFDIFQRLDNRGKFPGTGIGLAICKRVAQNHKGFILASGQPGRGAIFTLFLPVAIDSGGILADG